MSIQQGFPSLDSQMIDKAGRITAPWRALFANLWNRTGGANGNGYFALIGGSASQAFNVSTALTSTEAPNLTQVQGLDSTVLSSAETFATNAANTAQSNAEGFATSAANTAQANAETFATGQVRSLAGGAIATITVTASPFTYTAPSNGLVLIEGGTVTLQQLTRGATTLTAGAINSLIPVRTGDAVVVTYTAAPTMNFAPD